jgi:hypothetical protein
VLLADALGEDGVLVGGLAVGAHGYVRATDDVDFVTRSPLGEVRKRLAALGIETELRRGDVREGDFDCLKGSIDGTRFDVMPRLVPLEWERAIEVALSARKRLRVVDLDGLIRLKLRAQGPRDLMDVAALVLRHPARRATARDAARAYGVLDRLDPWLDDPRMRAEVAEDGRAAKNRRTRGSRGPARRRREPGRRK